MLVQEAHIALLFPFELPVMFALLVFHLWKSLLFVALTGTTFALQEYENVTSGVTRTYYIAAVEEEWDYMPR